MSGTVDVAVVGVGYLGTLHAEKYAAHPVARLRALVDPDPRARIVAERLGVPLFGDLSQLPREVRAASVAVPTPFHHAVGSRLIASGRDVLMEKPIAASPAQADELIALAERGGRILQVGHLERFNPAIRRVRGMLRDPRFIESHRLAPWNVRGTDVDVVLDLMIHDIDIILSLVPSEPLRILAAGVPVISQSVDIANARIEFENGCVANLTASRVSADKMRKIRVFQPEAYVSIDFLRRSTTIVRRVPGPDVHGAAARPAGAPCGPGESENGGEERFVRSRSAQPSGAAWSNGGIVREEISLEDEPADALALEIDAFLRAVLARGEPAVSGRDGRRALEVAGKIVELIGERGG